MPAIADSAHDVMRYARRPLEAIFAPRNVAVIGATEKAGSVGRTILWNLISNPFGGTVFPVNPRRPSVLGIKAYPRVADLPEPVDLAVVVTPAPTVPGIIGECADAGAKGAIVISAGFRECGPAGAELERQILEQARRGGMRIIGPNCLGVMSPLTGFNATFASAMARPGNVGFISQSGALCTAILDWSFRTDVGFSHFISTGSMLDVGWGDLIDFLGDDPRTQSILIYMESIGDARAFVTAAREVALTKPIIVIKAGRTEPAAKAAASHTGALTGSHEVLDAAFRRCGVLRVDTIAELFYMAEVLAKQPRPKGPRLTVLTNAGGPGVIATDALITGGGELAGLSLGTLDGLNRLLPAHWSHNNPIDLLGDADPDRYAGALEIAARDPLCDGLLVILAPQDATDPTKTAECLAPYAKTFQKPILASWMGGASVADGDRILTRASIPTFPYPDTAARVFNAMWRYSYNLRGLYETPTLPPDADENAPDRTRVEEVIREAQRSGRTILTEFESKQLLAAYRIPTVETRAASDEEEAVLCAEAIGYPVVLKLLSETVTHKSDAGGVRLNLCDADGVRGAYREIAASAGGRAGEGGFLGVTVQRMIPLDGYELIVGSSLDPQFGPVLLFGAGGQLVEVFRDRSLALPPLNTTLARRMMEQTRIFTALKGTRGRPGADLAALEQLLVRFSQLIVEQRRVREVDINPLLASAGRLIALDARVILHPADIREEDLPGPTVRPYPMQYARSWRMKDGAQVHIRPIRPEDEPLIVRLHEALSERSVYFRYFHPMKLSQRVAHERLTRICFIDYDREMALVATRKNPDTGRQEVIGVGRLTKSHREGEAEFAILISDEFQGRGLGTELLRMLLQVGRDERLRLITADILPENRDMQHISERLGFRLRHMPEEQIVRADIELGPESGDVRPASEP